MSVAAVPEDTPEPLALMPEEVRKSLSWLAHLIDAEIEVRAVHDEEQFAQRHLRLAPDEVASVREFPSPTSFMLAGRAFAEDLRTYSPPVGGCDNDEAPGWDRVRFDGAYESVPGSLVAAFPAGTVSPAALVVCFDNRYNELEIDVFAHSDAVAEAEAYISRLLDRGRGELNWFRGRAIRVSSSSSGVTFEPIETLRARRASLVLPDAVWREIDVNVTALFQRRELLSDLGLGTNRGLLLVGPPGTGKSGICRVLAAELAGSVTVLFCDARAMATRLVELYAELKFLGPCLVVLEDIDLIVGPRRSGSGDGGTLLEFLTALDGAMSRHSDVITVATTNDAASIDAAAKRAARFDRIIEVPLPDRLARMVILGSYLGPLTANVDVSSVSYSTTGASGADLRELVRRGVLEYGDELDTAGLRRLARRGSWRPATDVGQYL